MWKRAVGGRFGVCMRRKGKGEGSRLGWVGYMLGMGVCCGGWNAHVHVAGDALECGEVLSIWCCFRPAFPFWLPTFLSPLVGRKLMS